MNRTITEPCEAALPPDRQGEVVHRYILGVYELYRAADDALPGHPVRVVRERRRAVRPGHAGVRPAGLDERRHRCRRAAGDPVGDLAGLPAERDGAPTCRPCRTTRPGRVTPLATRAAVAFFGVFGYELDPTALGGGGAGSRSASRSRSTRAHRELLQYGRFHRLDEPARGGPVTLPG